LTNYTLIYNNLQLKRQIKSGFILKILPLFNIINFCFNDYNFYEKKNVTIQPPSKRIPFLGVFVNDM